MFFLLFGVGIENADFAVAGADGLIVGGDVGSEHADAGIEEIGGEILDAAIVDDTKAVVVAEKEIAWMDIGVEGIDAPLNLVVNKIPQELTKVINALLGWIGGEESIEVQAVDLSHGQYPLATELG